MSDLMLDGFLILLNNQNAWRPGDALPTFRPLYNQTHLYLAYVFRLFKPTLTENQLDFMDNIFSWALALKRYQSGDPISHDELLGIIYNLWYVGKYQELRMIHNYLKTNGGYIPEMPGSQFRMLELEACLDAAVGYKPSPWLQIGYSIRIMSRCFEKLQGNGSSFLRAWLSIPLMINSPISAFFILVFQSVMKLRRITLEDCFKEYFKIIPEMALAARGKDFID